PGSAPWAAAQIEPAVYPANGCRGAPLWPPPGQSPGHNPGCIPDRRLSACLAEPAIPALPPAVDDVIRLPRADRNPCALQGEAPHCGTGAGPGGEASDPVLNAPAPGRLSP